MQPWDFITLLTTEELKTAQIASNLKKKRKEARHNSNKVKLFNCEFFRIIVFPSLLSDCYTSFYIFFGFLHTELGAPVVGLSLLFNFLTLFPQKLNFRSFPSHKKRATQSIISCKAAISDDGVVRRVQF